MQLPAIKHSSLSLPISRLQKKNIQQKLISAWGKENKFLTL